MTDRPATVAQGAAAQARRARVRRYPLSLEQRRLRLASALFFSVVLFGWIAYQLVENLAPLDALYQTVITISTVGFREVVELGPGGQVLTMVLIVAGVGSVSYGAVTAAEFVVDGTMRRIIERRRMQREISDVRGHVIVCGFGRVGRHLADALLDEGAAFVVVDNDPDKLEELDELGYLFVGGEASEEQVLEEAGISRAGALVAAVNADADNVLITLTAKGVNPDVQVIARTKADENEAKLRRAGADRVIAPSTIGGRRIAQVLTRPVVADFLDIIAAGAVDYSLEELHVREDSELANSTLVDTQFRDRYGCTVLAIRSSDGSLDTHPRGTQVLRPGDVLVLMGAEEDLIAARDRLG